MTTPPAETLLAPIAQELFENSRDLLQVVSPEGGLVIANRVWRETLGYTESEVRSMEVSAILAPECVGEFKESLRQVVDGPGEASAKTTLLARDGTRIAVEGRLSRHTDGAGAISISVQFRNVTTAGKPEAALELDRLVSTRTAERAKTVERKLEETSHLLQQITENLQEVIWLFDNREQRLLYVSKGYELVWGRSVESLYADNRQYVEAIHELDRPVVFGALERQARGERTEMEYRVLRPDGTFRWVLDRSFPVFGEDGKLARTTGIAQDITERKVAEQKVEANRARLQRIIERAPVPMAYSDKAGRITLRNERYMRTIGYSPEDVATVDEWWTKAYPDADYRQKMQQLWTTAVDQAATTEGDVGSMACEIICKDGLSRCVEISGIKLDDGLLVVFVDVTERVHAEADLQKFRTIADQSPYGVAMTTMAGELVYINAAWQKMSGWSDDELRGQHLTVFHDERDLPRVRELFESLIQKGRFLGEEVFHKRRNGERYPTLMTAAVIRDSAGRPIFTSATCLDITDRVLDQTLISIQNEVLTQLGEGRPLPQVLGLICQRAEEWFDGAHALALKFQLDGKITAPGMASLAAAGFPPLECDPADPACCVPLRTCLETPRIVRDLSIEPIPEPLQGRLSKLGLHAFWSQPALDGDHLLGALAIIKPTPGEPNARQVRVLKDCARLVAIAISRHRVQQALEESEAYFRSLADSGTALIWTAGTDARCNYFNKPWLDFTGRTIEEEMGDGWLESVHADDLEDCKSRYVATFERREAFTLRYRLRRHDGEYRDIDDHGTPRYNHKGEFAGYIGHCFDVTDRLIAERQASRSQRLESIGQLAGGVAHDMNNALSPILISTALLAMRYPEASEIIDTVEASAKRCADMVRQLLTFARGAEGQKLLLQPRHIIKEIEKIVAGTFPKSIELHVNAPRDIAPIIGDPTQIHQVLLNLCVNARDAMPHGGVLTIKAENIDVDPTFACAVPEANAAKYVLLEVTDTGTGIPPEIIDRIFDPFFTTKGPDKGTGLGLSTLLGIAKGHGGFVRVDSQPGEGSKFQVYFPASADPTAATSASGTPAATFRGDGRLVLVVDDEAQIRKAMTAALKASGFIVATASDGTEGLIAAAERCHSLSCVITDIHMPTMDGVQFVRMLRRMLPVVPIIVASGRFDKPDEEQLKQVGVNVFLSKPFTQKTLLDALQACYASAPTHGHLAR